MTVSILWLFLAVPWVALQCVIVVFPDHTSFFVSLSTFAKKKVWDQMRPRPKVCLVVWRATLTVFINDVFEK